MPRPTTGHRAAVACVIAGATLAVVAAGAIVGILNAEPKHTDRRTADPTTAQVHTHSGGV